MSPQLIRQFRAWEITSPGAPAPAWQSLATAAVCLLSASVCCVCSV